MKPEMNDVARPILTIAAVLAAIVSQRIAPPREADRAADDANLTWAAAPVSSGATSIRLTTHSGELRPCPWVVERIPPARGLSGFAVRRQPDSAPNAPSEATPLTRRSRLQL